MVIVEVLVIVALVAILIWLPRKVRQRRHG